MRPSNATKIVLFVRGNGPLSQTAIQTLRDVCNAPSTSPHELRVVDVFQEPELAQHHRVRVTPTLLRVSPGPERRFVGDLSKQQILNCLELAHV